MIELEYLKPHHLDSFEPGEIDRGRWAALGVDTFLGHFVDKAMVAVEDRQTLGIAGIEERGGRVYGWLFVSDALLAKPLFLTKTIKRGLAYHMNDAEIAMISVRVPHDFEAAHRWTKFLGFEPSRDDRNFKEYAICRHQL